MTTEQQEVAMIRTLLHFMGQGNYKPSASAVLSVLRESGGQPAKSWDVSTNKAPGAPAQSWDVKTNKAPSNGWDVATNRAR